MKKIVALLLGAVCAFGCFAFAGCGDKKSDDPDKKPTKQPVVFDPWTKDDFLIGTWVSFGKDEAPTPSMQAQAKMLADSGVNFITHGGWITDYGEPVTRDMSDPVWWKHVDKVMKENNILYTFAADPNGANTNSVNTEAVLGATSNVSELGVQYAKDVVPHLENCMGFMVRDEPAYWELEGLATWAKKYANIKEGIKPFVNLFPSYAGTGLVGESYEAYLEKWVTSVGNENIEWLSHDFYPFRGNTTVEAIYGDLEAMRKVGRKHNLKTHGFPQSCQWENMRMPTAAEIRWNVNLYLAYGFKGLSYFNYVMWTGEGCSDGVIGLHGDMRHPELYEAMTNINNDIHYMNDTLMNFDCVHAYHTNNEPDCEQLPADALIGVDASERNFIVSYMASKDGSAPHIMLFNKSWRRTVEGQKFTVGANSGITGLELWDTETKTYKEVSVTDGAFTLDFAPGEGKYLRLKGDVVMA